MPSSEVDTLRKALEKAREQIQKQDELLQQLMSPPFVHGVVGPINKKDQTVMLYVKGEALEVALPEDPQMVVRTGDEVRVNPQTFQIVGLVASPLLTGAISRVRRNIDDMYVEVDVGGSVATLLRGQVKAEEGDRVILAGQAPVLLKNLGKEEERFSFTAETNISFEDIGGLQEAKAVLREAIEGATKNAELYKRYGKRPVKGVALYGPPGCGKTMLAKACVTAIASLHGKKVATGFIYVKGPEILSKWVGEAEQTIRGLFLSAKEHKRKHGYPAVIFIDEADSILPKRGTGQSSDVEKTIVAAFLAEMDGLEDSAAMVLLATNRAELLDPAVVRDGRIDRKLRVSRPDATAAEEIFRLNLDAKPFASGYHAQGMAQMAAKELYDPKYIIYSIRLKNGSSKDLTLSHITNGAMMASIVDQATDRALFRDAKCGKCYGLVPEDLLGAISAVYQQNLDLDLRDALAEHTAAERQNQSLLSAIKTDRS